MVRVAQDHLGAEVGKLAGRHGLDRAGGSDRHEDRGLDRAVGGRDAARARAATGGLERESEQRGGCLPPWSSRGTSFPTWGSRGTRRPTWGDYGAGPPTWARLRRLLLASLEGHRINIASP